MVTVPMLMVMKTPATRFYPGNFDKTEQNETEEKTHRSDLL